MFGLAAIVLFILAAVFQLAGLASGHLDAAVLAYAGLACLAIHVLYPWSPWTRRAP